MNGGVCSFSGSVESSSTRIIKTVPVANVLDNYKSTMIVVPLQCHKLKMS